MKYREVRFKDLPTGSGIKFRLKRDSFNMLKKIGPSEAIIIGYAGPDQQRDVLSRVGDRLTSISPDEEIVMVATA